jgi:tetratricopeptide (TPR) repeat protein
MPLLRAADHNQRGRALRERGQLKASLESYDQALRLRPDFAQAWNNRGIVLAQMKRFAAAVASYDRAIAAMPEYAAAFNNRGVALYEAGRYAAALASYERAIAIDPALADTFANMGGALAALGHAGAALACFDKAIALQPGLASACNMRGIVLRNMQRIPDAIASYEQALAIDPSFVEARRNKGLALLVAGDYGNGLPLYESRWEAEERTKHMRSFAQPMWLGDRPLAGRTILLHAEQGLGDTLQFIRYAVDVAALGAQVVIEAQRALLPLLRSSGMPGTLVEQGKPLPSFDLHCPLLSLPLAFRTTLESIPHPGPYLRTDPAKRAEWSGRLGPKSAVRVGIAFSGRRTHKNDRSRSMALSTLLQFLPSGFEYVSLQQEIRDSDRAALAAAQGLRHFGDELADFSDTAALCESMDVVLSVDTSVAHLAAALGRPTWIMLPYAADWRWLLNREDSPWYASAKLYRQDAGCRWDPVLQRVNRDLAGLKRRS